ncbi:hypothetical protein ACOMHN_002128 [Nucella lapillus]
MTRGGSKNVRHGLHLLTDGEVSRIKCPWPLDFFDAINRTAFTITLPHCHFPIDPNKYSLTDIFKQQGHHEVRKELPRASVAPNASSPKPQHVDRVPSESKKPSRMVAHSKKRAVSISKRKGTSSSSDWHPRDANENATAAPGSERDTEDKKEGYTTEDDPQNGTTDRRVFLTAMEDVPCNGTPHHGQPAERGARRPFSRAAANKPNRDRNTNMRSRGWSFESSSSCRSKVHTAESDASEMENQQSSKKEEKQVSCRERRKNYLIPDHCKPRAPATQWKKSVNPYECASPPVYIHIEILTGGDTFISRGAEVVTLNKRFFMSFADDKTHVAIREFMHIYPTQKSVQTRYRLQLAWDLYSQKVRDDFYQEMSRQGKKNLGTYFDRVPVEFGDPYGILKEEH